VAIIPAMCDYMYYEHKQRARIKNSIPETKEQPELEKVEEHPMTVKA
jgi:hypothetical protein